MSVRLQKTKFHLLYKVRLSFKFFLFLKTSKFQNDCFFENSTLKIETYLNFIYYFESHHTLFYTNVKALFYFSLELCIVNFLQNKVKLIEWLLNIFLFQTIGHHRVKIANSSISWKITAIIVSNFHTNAFSSNLREAIFVEPPL